MTRPLSDDAAEQLLHEIMNAEELRLLRAELLAVVVIRADGTVDEAVGPFKSLLEAQAYADALMADVNGDGDVQDTDWQAKVAAFEPPDELIMKRMNDDHSS